jgi:hypothetical protein
MQIFEVIRWGNASDDPHTGGGNGPDTCFLVRAESVEQAAALADQQLVVMANGSVDPWAGAVYQLGTDLSEHPDSRILRGPYLQHAYRHGWRHWYRHDQNGPWVETTEA